MGQAFAVASNGQDVQAANGPNQLLSMNNPFTKLDTTNIVSFQTIQLLLNHEPPQAPPTAPYYTDTVVYQFPHGYQYVPAIWMSWAFPSANPNPGNPGVGSSNTVSFPNGDDTASSAAYEAISGGIIAGGNSTLALEQYNDGSGTQYVSEAYLYLTVDTANVYVHIMKGTLGTLGGSIIPLYLIGYVINLRTYVFTEPGTTSTY